MQKLSHVAERIGRGLQNLLRRFESFRGVSWQAIVTPPVSTGGFLFIFDKFFT